MYDQNVKPSTQRGGGWLGGWGGGTLKEPSDTGPIISYGTPEALNPAFGFAAHADVTPSQACLMLVPWSRSLHDVVTNFLPSRVFRPNSTSSHGNPKP